MKTQMKSDALLDAFENYQLSEEAMNDLKGGDHCVRYLTPSGYVYHTISDDGSVRYMNIIGPQTKEYLIENNDHMLK